MLSSVLLSSHSPSPKDVTSGGPTGQLVSNIFISLPIINLSCDPKSYFNQSRTGSLPASVLKKTTDNVICIFMIICMYQFWYYVKNFLPLNMSSSSCKSSNWYVNYNTTFRKRGVEKNLDARLCSSLPFVKGDLEGFCSENKIPQPPLETGAVKKTRFLFARK